MSSLAGIDLSNTISYATTVCDELPLFSHIVATDKHRGIGKNGDLVWQLPKDMAYFKKITSETSTPNKQNIVIMGRITWESIPEKYRPLNKRINMVLSRNPLPLPENAHHFTQFNDALKKAKHLQEQNQAEHIFVMGGAKLYQDTITHPNCHKLYITQINHSYDCDAFYPEYKNNFSLETSSPVITDNGTDLWFKCYTRTDQSVGPSIPF